MVTHTEQLQKNEMMAITLTTMGVPMQPLTHYMYAGVDHPHQLTSENYEQTDTIQTPTKNTAQSINVATVSGYQKRHETMETP